MAEESQKRWRSARVSSPRDQYCIEHTVRFAPIQTKLYEETQNNYKAVIMGASEVFQLCSNLIQLIGGKKCLDIGTYTGASALAWALAIPEDGTVITMDIQDEDYKKYGQDIIAESGVASKIQLVVQSAQKTLDDLLAQASEPGTWDFVFVDADKKGYPDYYEKSLQLLRPGGVIALDNMLQGGKVYSGEPIEPGRDAAIVDQLNKKIHQDSRVTCSLLPIGDGLMLVFKK